MPAPTRTSPRAASGSRRCSRPSSGCSAARSEAMAVRVVVCEDSGTYRRALVRALEHDGELSVVGAFGTAEAMLSALPALAADLVTMDLELPGMQGLQAVEQIMGEK